MSTHTKTQNNPAIFFVVLLFIAVGLTFVVSGIYLGTQHKDIDDGRIHTTATIVDIQEDIEDIQDDIENIVIFLTICFCSPFNSILIAFSSTFLSKEWGLKKAPIHFVKSEIL